MTEKFGRVIRDLRKQKGLTQRRLAELAGMNFTYLSKMENGRLPSVPTSETLNALAEALDVDGDRLHAECGRIPERLADRMAENPEFAQQICKLRDRDLDASFRQPYRLAGLVPAGPTLEAVEDTEEFDVTDLFCPGEHYALRIRGDSMIEAGIFDGDVAIVRPQSDCRNGDIVIALVDGYEATLKRFYREGNRIRLQPENEAMEPIFVDADRVDLRGVVVGLIRPRVS